MIWLITLTVKQKKKNGVRKRILPQQFCQDTIKNRQQQTSACLRQRLRNTKRVENAKTSHQFNIRQSMINLLSRLIKQSHGIQYPVHVKDLKIVLKKSKDDFQCFHQLKSQSYQLHYSQKRNFIAYARNRTEQHPHNGAM